MRPAPSAHLPPGPAAVLALQRAAGNEAINALILGRMRMPGATARRQMDEAYAELQRDEPAIDKVEGGLKAAKALGIPVDLEGIKPPPSALAVTTTGFGPGNVAAKKPVPPPKPTPPISPLGRAAAKKAPGGQAAGPPPVAAGDLGGGLGAAAPVTVDPQQPPVAPGFVRPADDPAFTSVTGRVKATAKQKRSHAPAAAKAKQAQDAALPPTNDLASQAKAAKADTMEAQRPGSFDKKAFITAVEAAVAAKTPTTLAQADTYKESGKTAEVKGEVRGLVATGTQEQAHDIAEATAAPPDPSKTVAKPVTPMGPEPTGALAPVPAAGAVPKPAPADQLNLASGPRQAEEELAQAEVTEDQLAESNEPQFAEALADKRAVAAHADTAPAAYRAEEAQVIGQDKADAQAATAAGLSGMQSSRGAALTSVVADKARTKTKDEAKRAEVTSRVESIFTATEGEVKRILGGIDPLVEQEFNAGEAAARGVFERFVSAKMSAYKKDRYGGWLGKFRWLRDKIRGMPAKVNEFYVAGRELYLKEMTKTISRVADIVGTGLTQAKTRIARGQAEIAAYVKSLPKDLRKVGADAGQEIADRFAQLESDVDAKKDALVDDLASRYVAARKGLDERIEALQAENRGLIDKAIGAIKAVINTIRELVSMLTGVLARAAGVIGQIVKHPIRFLGNLVAGVKGGVMKFKEDFFGHLKRGLMRWLFGALAETGIDLPRSFDPKSIVGFLASIFGLTWDRIRKRLVRQIGEPAMVAVEKGVEIFTLLSGPEGVGGLWQLILDKVGDVKNMIFESVKDFVKDRIITAGVTWLIGLLNPAAAFVKACKMIYDIVVFFVNNAGRIKAFVDTVLDSVSDMVRGNVGAVVNKVNDALGQMVPIIIGFLASLVNLGGIGQKVRELVDRLQKPVTQAVDFLIAKGLHLAGPIIRRVAGVAGKVKAKVAAGKAWAKGKAESGREWVKAKGQAIAGFFTVRREFDVDGESHTLYSSGDTLIVASTPTDLDKHPDAGVRAAYRAYRSAVDTATTPTGKEKAAKKPLARIITVLKKWLKRTKKKDPQASAPEVGNIAQHKDQPSSLRKRDVAVWELESEHVIPRAMSNAAFLTLSLQGIPAGKTDYVHQTTIMIYRGAATRKTHGGEADNAMSAEIKQNLAEVLAEFHKTKASQQMAAAELVIDAVLRLFAAYAEDAVGRTSIAVEHESKQNRARRGPPGKPETKIPDAGRIRAAAMQQIKDIERQLKSRLR